MDSTQALSPDEQVANQRETIEALAEDTATPVDEVVLVYEAELASLKEWARVGDFVELFATRRTRDRLLLRRQH
jgi:hypothetical protein